MLNLKVGQEVGIKYINTTGRGSTKPPTTGTVSKVSKKYFELKEFSGKKFYLENGYDVNRFRSSMEIHPTLQEILDKMEKEKLFKAINKKIHFFNYHLISLDKLRRLHQIFEEE